MWFTHTSKKTSMKEFFCFPSILLSYSLIQRRKRGIKIFPGRDPHQQPCSRVCWGSGGSSCLTKDETAAGHSHLLSVKTLQLFPLKRQQCISRVLTCSLDAQIFLQSPLAWLLICSLGPAILKNEWIFFFWLEWQCSF